MMETLFSASGFPSEASLPGIPRTPPYTPARAKQRLERSVSPSSNAGSIHPTETCSPNKDPAKRTTAVVQDDIRIQELVEGDVGYQTDLDIVYPEELEEISSDSEDDDDDDDDDDGSDDNDDEDVASSSGSDVDDNEDDVIARNLSRMRCEDEQEKGFAHRRQQARRHKRADSRAFKRSHSQSVKSETEAADVDGKDDHDLESSSRRLRRRVQGPNLTQFAPGEHVRSSPEIGHLSGGGTNDSPR